MKEYQHILFATDFARDSKAISEKAREIADKYAAKLSAIHVVESIPEPSIGYMMLPDIEYKLIEDSKITLAKIGTQLNIAPENQFVEVGSPKSVIIETAVKNHVDLIVVGSHGHHGWALLLGSTAASILHAAHCDVLIVKLK